MAAALVSAGQQFGHRLPELFCGFDRKAFGFAVPYPTACIPQAWAAASTLQLVRVLLGLEPDRGRRGPRSRPILPRDALPLRLEGVTVGAGRISMLVDGDGALHTDFTPRTDSPPQR